MSTNKMSLVRFPGVKTFRAFRKDKHKEHSAPSSGVAANYRITAQNTTSVLLSVKGKRGWKLKSEPLACLHPYIFFWGGWTFCKRQCKYVTPLSVNGFTSGVSFSDPHCGLCVCGVGGVYSRSFLFFCDSSHLASLISGDRIFRQRFPPPPPQTQLRVTDADEPERSDLCE